MALSDVVAATDISGFTEAETLRFKKIIVALYNNSETARTMLEDWTITQNKRITFTWVENAASAQATSGNVSFDFAYASGRSYVDDNGNAAPETPLIIIAHQLATAINGLNNNWDTTYAGDYRGEAVDFANIIYDEMGLPLRNSYIGSGTQLSIGQMYTGGAAIDRSIVANGQTTPVLDSSPANLSHDLLVGYAMANDMRGGQGNDWLYGEGGDDTLNSGSGDDFLSGGSGNDMLDAGTGDDFVYGRENDDQLIGGAGMDTLIGGPGDDFLEGQADDDMLMGGAGSDSIYGGDGSDQIKGSIGADHIFGEDGADLLSGEGGNDVLDGGSGDDTVLGGAGHDDLRGDSGDDVMAGGHGDDVVKGATGSDVLLGGLGNDTLNGGAGDDVLNGGIGEDHLNGGDGQDAFIFNTSRGNWKLIEDFDSGVDVIRFAEVMGANGMLVADGMDADSNGDGVINALDDGWSDWNANGLMFDGADTDLYIQFAGANQTLLATDII